MTIGILFSECSFKSNKVIQENSNLIESELTSITGKKIKFVEYPCEVARNYAKQDLEDGQLYFFDIIYFDENRSNKEMSKLLSEFNIQLFETYGIDVEPLDKNCYEKFMNSEIVKKYGNNFLDSIRVIAEIEYVKNNASKVYSFEECDTTSRYLRANTYSDFFDKYKEDFFRRFTYPKDYKFKNEKYYSYTSAEFVLQKDTTVTISHIETTFQNAKNEVYTELFNERVREFINTAKWIPAKSAGIEVASKVPLTLHYK